MTTRSAPGRADVTKWKRFTPRARHVMFFSQQEAARLGTSEVGTEHLLLAVVRERECTAARVLERLGVGLGSIRQKIFREVPIREAAPAEEVQLTAAAKQAIDIAAQEARNLGSETIGTEHILLGLFLEGKGIAAKLLTSEFKLTIGKLREGVEAYRSEMTQKQRRAADALGTDYVYTVFPVALPDGGIGLEEIASHIEAEVVSKASQGWELVSTGLSPVPSAPGALLFMKRRLPPESKR
jgi:ATP-dependent Clp protease ATP-binding subunit ClpA